MMEKEYRISWLKVIGVLILIVILITILCFIYPKKDKKSATSVYINNINLLKEAGFEYFQGDNLPGKIGESKKITLEEMLTSNYLIEFFDENNNSCNKVDSYVEVTKSLDNEYTMKVFLSCDNKSDYIITTIKDDNCLNCDNGEIENEVHESENSSNNVNNNKIDKETNNISNNTNSSTSNNKVTYVTNYNINYVNNCKNCSDSNCNTNCIYNVYHTVDFDSNGGSSVNKQIVKHGNKATSEISIREGYKFLGWYLDGEKYDFNTPVTKKFTLIAKWNKVVEEDKKYTVSFDSNGGSKVNSQTVLEGQNANKPKDPNRDCYLFVGWYTNKKLTNKYDFSTPVTEDITLYAKWKYDEKCNLKYTVSFDSNGGSKVNSQTVLEGEKAFSPNNPVRNGYTFLGWYLNGNIFNFNTRIYNNITLEAKWEKDIIKYNTYCAKTQKRYYSTSYVGTNQDTWNMSWTIKFDNLRNVDDLKIVDVGYITTNSMYNELYYNYLIGRGITMVNGNDKGVVPISSGEMLKNYSLKYNNFYKSLSNPYYSNGYWYTDAYVIINNYNNVTKYYASNINKYIYFVPFYFDVLYTDKSSCFDDLASNASLYEGYYTIVNSYYK